MIENVSTQLTVFHSLCPLPASRKGLRLPLRSALFGEGGRDWRPWCLDYNKGFISPIWHWSQRSRLFKSLKPELIFQFLMDGVHIRHNDSFRCLQLQHVSEYGYGLGAKGHGLIYLKHVNSHYVFDGGYSQLKQHLTEVCR